MRHLTCALGVMNMKQLSVYEPHNDAIYEVILALFSAHCSSPPSLSLSICHEVRLEYIHDIDR